MEKYLLVRVRESHRLTLVICGVSGGVPPNNDGHGQRGFHTLPILATCQNSITITASSSSLNSPLR